VVPRSTRPQASRHHINGMLHLNISGLTPFRGIKKSPPQTQRTESEAGLDKTVQMTTGTGGTPRSQDAQAVPHGVIDRGRTEYLVVDIPPMFTFDVG
jgi:hypothetical protein